jgi:hypothetical protein
MMFYSGKTGKFRSFLIYPEGNFINKGQGGIQNLPLDSIDAANWPLVVG